MSHPNSNRAYRIIEKNGLLSERKFQVYECLHLNGPKTINEVSAHYPQIDSRSLSPRFAELKDLGVIKVVGTKKDPHTKHINDVYAVTGSLPVKKQKQKVASTEQRLRIALEVLSEVQDGLDVFEILLEEFEEKLNQPKKRKR